MRRFDIFLKLTIIIFSILWTMEAWSACRSVHYSTGQYAGANISGTTITESGLTTGSWGNDNTTQTEDNNSALIPIGNIHLMDEAIQPNGSSLAIASVPPTGYRIRNTNAESILWACSPSTDMSKIRFLVSVNGDDRVGGYYEVEPANAGGEQNVFYTWFKSVGIRQYIDGEVLGRQYKGVPIQYETGAAGTVGWARNKCQPGWRCIRLKHLPTMQFELIRVGGQPPYTNSINNYCNGRSVPSNAVGDDRGMGQSGNYICNQPSSYITLGDSEHQGVGSSGGDQYVAFPHDGIGVTHTTVGSSWYFWGADNGFGYTLFNAVNLRNNAVSCKVNMVTPNVKFETTTMQRLNANRIISQNFQVQVDCKDGVNSGIGTDQIAIGIKPSQGAFNAAQNFSPTLVNSNNGVAALLSDDYSNAARAKNVGIYIKYQNSNNYITLLGQPGGSGSTPATSGDHSVTCGIANNQACYPATVFPSGNTAGWYPVLNNASAIGSPLIGYTRYNINYTADLKKIPGAADVTAGSIYSTATVVVKIQ